MPASLTARALLGARRLCTSTFHPCVVVRVVQSDGRLQGARDNLVLKPTHMRIAEKRFGVSIPRAKCGRRTLTAAACNAQGQGRLQNAEVTVAGAGCP
jgi:hypothetical protein